MTAVPATAITDRDWLSAQLRLAAGLYGEAGPVVLGTIWWYSVSAVLVTPALDPLVATGRAMDPALEESSRMSGASRARTFFGITFVLMLPVMTSAFIQSFIRGIESFESPVFFGTPARIEVLTTKIYALINHSAQPQYQAATALGFAAMAVMFLLVRTLPVAARARRSSWAGRCPAW